ncbi:uncharacterized protein [Littorina saxatilis]|uniref:uncharacterized protein n=1 Tax=Littorina saxatilis TaxID=31220 RepID=UPI0038B44AC8
MASRCLRCLLMPPRSGGANPFRYYAFGRTIPQVPCRFTPIRYASEGRGSQTVHAVGPSTNRHIARKFLLVVGGTVTLYIGYLIFTAPEEDFDSYEFEEPAKNWQVG